jgi:hypothetical protein
LPGVRNDQLSERENPASPPVFVGLVVRITEHGHSIATSSPSGKIPPGEQLNRYTTLLNGVGMTAIFLPLTFVQRSR